MKRLVAWARGRRAEGRNERGAVAVVAAMCALVLFVVAGLVVDLGLARDVRRQSQIASDASALAAANALYPQSGSCLAPVGAKAPCLQDAVSAAQGYAEQNFGVTASDWSTCADPGKPSTYKTAPQAPVNCITFDSLTAPTRVRVTMPVRDVPTGFSAVTGVDRVQVRSLAQAKVDQTPPANCGLCFLGTVDAGNGDFSVSGASIMVNGGISSGPNGRWTATGTGSIIGVVSGTSGGVYSPGVTAISSFTDPLAGLSLPLSTAGLKTGLTDPCKQGPGVYTGNVTLKNNDTCTLTQGLYVISGTWLEGNKSLIKGTNVTLYVKKPGKLDFKNGDVNIVAPTTAPTSGWPSGTPLGLAVVYDRDNTNSLGLQGNGGTQITGTVYARASSLDFNGNSCFGFSKGPVVALGVIKANGNKSCVVVSDAVGAAVTQPPAVAYLDQ